MDIKEPLSDDERALVTLFRRAHARLPHEAQAILIQARATAATIDGWYEQQARIDAEKRALLPLDQGHGSSVAARKKPKAV